MGAARPLPALGPAVMVPQRGPLLLLALSLGLACAQQTLEEVPVQPGFNAQKVEGRWLTIQLASSRAHLVSPADPLRLGLHSIWTRDEDVTFVLFWTGEGVCQGVNVTVHPTGLQGQFQGSWEGGNSMHVCFVGTDYSNLVLYVRLEDAGEVTSLWALLGRWWPSPTPGRLPGPVLTASGSLAAQSCTPVGAPQVGHPCLHRSIPQEFLQPISRLLRLCPGSGDAAPEQKPSPAFAGEIACEPKSH
ncbi:beta-lactoglobulin isoform X1 [Herpailurus yagouaroundi]|uniref:beta-lactoglobulin isoform X1 n=1 Tax=Herpailurus yagouaroundi TaxID=1608482 RepID=UPI001AD6C144|nr:beta-lactoglobulin isoform X1 [Puma yagouaroundi]